MSKGFEKETAELNEMKETINDFRLVISLHLMEWIINFAPNNKQGIEVKNAVRELLKKQLEKK